MRVTTLATVLALATAQAATAAAQTFEVPPPAEVLAGCPELAQTDIARIEAYAPANIERQLRQVYWYAFRSVRPGIERDAPVVVRFFTDLTYGMPNAVVFLARDADGGWTALASQRPQEYQPGRNRIEMAPSAVPADLGRTLDAFIDGGCLAAEPMSRPYRLPLKGGGERELCGLRSQGWVMQIDKGGVRRSFMGSCRPWPSGGVMTALARFGGELP